MLRSNSVSEIGVHGLVLAVQLVDRQSEVVSSRTHFEVLGLGLKASSPRKLPCPRLEDSTVSEFLKFCWKTPETWRKICKDLFLVSSSRDCLKKNFEDVFCPKKNFEDLFFEIAWKKFWNHFFFRTTFASVSWVFGLGLKIFLCPWPWPRALCPRLHLCRQNTAGDTLDNWLLGYISIDE